MLVCSSVGSLSLARILSVWWIGWPDNKILIKLGNRIWKLSACPISEGKYLEASLQLQLFCGWLSFLFRKNINYRHCQINTKRQPCSFQIIYNIYSYLCFLLFFFQINNSYECVFLFFFISKLRTRWLCSISELEYLRATDEKHDWVNENLKEIVNQHRRTTEKKNQKQWQQSEPILLISSI